MQLTTFDRRDITLDGLYWRLVSLAEWTHFWGLRAGAGIAWRDADATRHRLLTERADGTPAH